MARPKAKHPPVNERSKEYRVQRPALRLCLGYCNKRWLSPDVTLRVCPACTAKAKELNVRAQAWVIRRDRRESG